MTTTSPKTRQITNIATLPRLTQLPLQELDNVLASADSEATPVYQLTANNSLVITVNSATITNPTTSLNRTTPVVVAGSSSILSSATITLPGANNGSVVASPGSSLLINMFTTGFARLGVHVDPSGNIGLTISGSSAALAGVNMPPYLSGYFMIGYIVLQTVSSAMTAISNSSIYQFPSPLSFVNGLPTLTGGAIWVGTTTSTPIATTIGQGATNGVVVTLGSGSITLDTAQDIRTTATPTFAGLTLTGPLHMTGGLDVNVSAIKTTSYTITTSDCVVQYSTSSGALTLTLPTSVSGNKGQVLFLKDVGGSIGIVGKSMTLAPNGTDTIDGTNASIVVNFAPYTSLMLVASATGAWVIL